jgi:hypothetical protein
MGSILSNSIRTERSDPRTLLGIHDLAIAWSLYRLVNLLIANSTILLPTTPRSLHYHNANGNTFKEFEKIVRLG